MLVFVFFFRELIVFFFVFGFMGFRRVVVFFVWGFLFFFLDVVYVREVVCIVRVSVVLNRDLEIKCVLWLFYVCFCFILILNLLCSEIMLGGIWVIEFLIIVYLCFVSLRDMCRLLVLFIYWNEIILISVYMRWLVFVVFIIRKGESVFCLGLLCGGRFWLSSSILFFILGRKFV